MNRSNTSSFFKRNQAQKLDITTKVSQKELKKNKKNQKNQSNNTCVSDNDFDKLMEENSPKMTPERFDSYLEKITNFVKSDILTQLVQEGTGGDDLTNRLKYENITGSQLLNAILEKYKLENLSWMNKEEYGCMLYNLLEDNFQEQLLCLLVVQYHCIQNGMPKITYKDKHVYCIKLLFQLMFTHDMIDESVYWQWYELASTFVDIEEDTKNKICIQTTEFFNILKLSFTDEDYENNEDENVKNVKTDKTDKVDKTDKTDKAKADKVDKTDTVEDTVPEEQDYYMDDVF